MVAIRRAVRANHSSLGDEEWNDHEAHQEMLQEVLAFLRARRINQTDLDVFELHVLDGLSRAKIEERTSKSLGAVYVALSRACKKVEAELSSRQAEEDAN